jgi:hypothetical protein
MGEVTNLRQARKRKRRSDRERDAAANRAMHGRRPDEVRRMELSRAREDQRLEGHRRVGPVEDERET